MSNLGQWLMESTIERITLTNIRNVMETCNMTTEQAMWALKIPETERPKYIALLEGNEEA